MHLYKERVNAWDARAHPRKNLPKAAWTAEPEEAVDDKGFPRPTCPVIKAKLISQPTAHIVKAILQIIKKVNTGLSVNWQRKRRRQPQNSPPTQRIELSRQASSVAFLQEDVPQRIDQQPSFFHGDS